MGIDTDSKLKPEDTFFINNREYTSRFFHCFGDRDTIIDLPTVVSLLQKSGTQFLTLNTHHIDEKKNKDALVIGYTDITLERVSVSIDMSEYTVLINTNLAASSEEAVRRAILASSVS